MKPKKPYKSAQLYQYQGGGYDGCYWEWNFCLIVDGKFYDILSSGRNAIKSKEELKEYLNYDKTSYKYNLNKKADILEFTKETSESFQGAVIGKVNDILNTDLMYYTCTYCTENVHFKQTEHDDYPQYFHDEQNYSGDGGIGVRMHSIICETCYCTRCDECDSILQEPDTHTIKTPDDKYYDEKQVCTWCFEDHNKKQSV